MKLRRKEFKRVVALEAVLFFAGLILVPLAFCLLCQLAESMFWRLKLKYHYTEGRARVEKVEVLPYETEFRVEVTHRLVNGKERHETSLNTEEEPPTRRTAAEAEALGSQYQVGQLYPCWYLPDEPDYYSVLLKDGLDMWWPVRAVWIPLLIGIPGWFGCRWSWRRWKKRGWGKETPS